MSEGTINLPALCDEAIRDLAEAKDIDGVLAIRAQAEAMRVLAKQRGLAVHAQNRCAQIVALASARIGEELKRGKEKGKVAVQGGDKRWIKSKIVNDDLGSITLAEIGITPDQSSEFQLLASVPAEVIAEAVEVATAADKPVSKAAIRRAAKVAKEKVSSGKKKPSAPRKTKLAVDDLARPKELGVFHHWILRGQHVLEKCGDAAALAAAARRTNVFIDPSLIFRVEQFLTAYRQASEAVQAA